MKSPLEVPDHDEPDLMLLLIMECFWSLNRELKEEEEEARDPDPPVITCRQSNFFFQPHCYSKTNNKSRLFEMLPNIPGKLIQDRTGIVQTAKARC